MSILKMKQETKPSAPAQKPSSLALAYNVQKQGKKPSISKIESEDLPPVTNIAEAILARSKPKPEPIEDMEEEFYDTDLDVLEEPAKQDKNESLVSKILKKTRK